MNITIDCLPSGSGFDCSWDIEEMKGYTKATSSFHVMNSDGYYVGYAVFSVIIPKDNPRDFRLHFHGSHSQYLNRKHMLREHMEDTILYNLKAQKEF